MYFYLRRASYSIRRVWLRLADCVSKNVLGISNRRVGDFSSLLKFFQVD
jgi:hypothetical protein